MQARIKTIKKFKEWKTTLGNKFFSIFLCNVDCGKPPRETEPCVELIVEECGLEKIYNNLFTLFLKLNELYIN